MRITRRLFFGHGVKASFLLPSLLPSLLSARSAQAHATTLARPTLAQPTLAQPTLAQPALAQPALAHPTAARPDPMARAPGRTTPGRPLPLVMLDPGHGGKDPGAIGYSGTYEKHVALATAQELAHLLLASGRYRVQLTRGRDVFIRLEDRVAIAQKAGAALFVSMHADSLPDPAVRGASVYTLAENASDQQTAALAQRENAADRFAGPSYAGVPPDVAHILASLVRQETRTGSARMAHSVVTALDSSLPMLTTPARHAAFVVLKAADIPSVLVEMGFMSNPRDEAALRQASHRVLVATSMKRAVDAWFASATTLTESSL